VKNPFSQAVSWMGACKASAQAVFAQIFEVPRNVKQGMMLVVDMLLATMALVIAYGYPFAEGSQPPGATELFSAAVTLLATAAIFLRIGLYRAIIRFMGQQAIWAFIQAVSYSTLVLGATIFFTRADVPRSMPFIYWALAMCSIGGVRLAVRASYQAGCAGTARTCSSTVPGNRGGSCLLRCTTATSIAWLLSWTMTPWPSTR
jgi:FlaA1/EpsC-like NDP-sugar epimerase